MVEPKSVIDEVATWLASTKVKGNVIVELRKRFHLSAVQACHVVREAGILKVRPL